MGPVSEEPLAAGLPRGAARVSRGLDRVAEPHLSGGRWRGDSEGGSGELWGLGGRSCPGERWAGVPRPCIRPAHCPALPALQSTSVTHGPGSFVPILQMKTLKPGGGAGPWGRVPGFLPCLSLADDSIFVPPEHPEASPCDLIEQSWEQLVWGHPEPSGLVGEAPVRCFSRENL